MGIEQLFFIALISSALFVFFRNALIIKKNIQLGKKIDLSDNKSERWKRMLLIAFGQKKMFKRPMVAFLHLLVYAGFLIVNIELLEIIIDGVTGNHRVFEPFLGNFYGVVITIFEFFALCVLVSCIIFLIRRNVLKIERFQKPEMSRWPKLDANLILVLEIVLMLALLTMNATDQAMAIQKGDGSILSHSFFFSAFLVPIFKGMSMDSLHLIERITWWFHIVGICFFANYVLFSKHLHIFLAFPNTFFSNLNPKGKMDNMDEVTQEVKIMLGMQTPDPNQPPAEISRFGAKDVIDLSWKNILDAYTCTECGRCTDNCPANQTGKMLSPRKIMMDTRDRAEELGAFKRKEGKDAVDDKTLLNNYITDEEINACTTCNACTEACPINIDPLNIIVQLRRYKIMEESQGPAEWQGMYQNIETSFSPWKFPPTDRFNWASNIQSTNKSEESK